MKKQKWRFTGHRSQNDWLTTPQNRHKTHTSIKKEILIKIQSLIFKDPVFEINTVKLFDLYNISQAKWYTTNDCHKIPQPVTCVKKNPQIVEIYISVQNSWDRVKKITKHILYK